MGFGAGIDPEKRLPLDRQTVVRGGTVIVLGTGGGQKPCGEGRADHLPQGVEVVGRGPAEELQFVGGEKGFRVQELEHRLQLFGGVDGAKDYANEASPAKGNQHPFPHRNLRQELRWHKIVIGGVKVQGDGDVDGGGIHNHALLDSLRGIKNLKM
jgi:hypothetical protein